jgi:thiamine biosynthesis lipoprotein
MEYDEFSAMNTIVQVAAEGDLKELKPGFERVRQFVEQSEEQFSRFRETSELTRLNHSAGTWFYASPAMFDLVKTALQLHSLTGGLFDPSILGALRRAGYDRSMDEIRRSVALPARIDRALNSPPFEETRLDPETNAIYLPTGIQIDLGGIAKGWIAAQAAEQLSQFTDACAVSAGGDMALLGLPTGECAWEVSLEDPFDIDQVIAILKIPPGGLATSTVTRRQWTQGGQLRHHIIDPRSGEPSASRWLSVTIYANSILYAEAFAKALLIAGPSDAQSLLSRMDGLQYAAVEPCGEITGTLENMEMIYVSEPIL